MTRTWPALLTVHVAWSVHLLASYYLAWADCASDSGWPLGLRHLATIVASGLVAWAIWHELRATASAPDRPDGGQDRQVSLLERVNLARITLTLSVIYLLAILMTGAASPMLPPCQ